jgi:hypothetical protein
MRTEFLVHGRAFVGRRHGYKDEAHQNPRRSVRKLAQGCCPNYRALVDGSAKPRRREASPSQVGYPQVMTRRREIVRATPHDQRDHSFVSGMVSQGVMPAREMPQRRLRSDASGGMVGGRIQARTPRPYSTALIDLGEASVCDSIDLGGLRASLSCRARCRR